MHGVKRAEDCAVVHKMINTYEVIRTAQSF